MNLNLGDPFVHRLKITDTSLDKLPNESNFLIYLFVRRKDFHVTDFQKEVSQFAENHHIHTLLTDSTPESKKCKIESSSELTNNSESNCGKRWRRTSFEISKKIANIQNGNDGNRMDVYAKSFKRVRR